MKSNTVQQNIPIGWAKKALNDLVLIKKGEQLNRLAMDDSGKYPALNGGISPSGYTDKWNTDRNTITISEGGNSCGFVNFNTERFWCGGHCYALLNIDSSLNINFLYQFLKSKQNQIMKLRVGSGLPNIQKRSIEEFSVIFPKSKTEQQKIAEILGSVDEDIAKTQEVIETTEKLKRGLMQQLFTRGLRGISAEIVPLGKVAKVQGGYSFKSSEFSDNGVPVIRISNIKDGYIKLDDIKYYPKEITKRFESFSLNKDDVVIAMSGATTGKIGIVKELDLPLLLNQRVGRFILSEEVDGKYLYNIVISEFYQKRIWDFAIGGAQPNVSGPQLESIEIPLPEISVQREIAEILSSVDEKILVNKKLKEKLTLLKKGLMQDLLSGKVRTITN